MTLVAAGKNIKNAADGNLLKPKRSKSDEAKSNENGCKAKVTPVKGSYFTFS